MTPALVRFMARVLAPAENGGCWRWAGAVNNAGYPTFQVRKRTWPAYRWLYEQLEREVPAGLELDHLCRTPLCVNPDHVEPVTHRENQRRGNSIMGTNARKTHCARGHEFTIPFSEEAEVPPTWECRLDGTTAQLVDGPEPEAKKTKPPRTHWDMLMERRTVADLEEVLAERLDVLRARRGQKSA